MNRNLLSPYSLGKIISKYLILDIFAYSGRLTQAFPVLTMTNHNLRLLAIRNIKLVYTMLYTWKVDTTNIIERAFLLAILSGRESQRAFHPYYRKD